MCCLTGLLFLLMIAIFWSLNTGTLSVSFTDLIQEIFNENNQTVKIIKDLRLPRILIAIFAGAALSVSAVLLQLITRNPLAESGLLGISAGAEMGCYVIYLFFPFLFKFANFFGFVGGIVAATILMFSTIKKKQHTLNLIVVGISIHAFLSGINNILSLKLTNSTSAIIQNANQGIGLKGWGDVKWIVPMTFLFLLITFALSSWCNVLLLSESTLHSLGVATKFLSILFTIIAVVLSSITVSTIGIVSFLGLLVAHLSRKIIGTDHRWLLPFSALLGASLLLIADTLGRSLFLPAEVSANNIMMIIGGFVLLLFVLKGEMFNGE